jgi:hypothetical protein
MANRFEIEQKPKKFVMIFEEVNNEKGFGIPGRGNSGDWTINRLYPAGSTAAGIFDSTTAIDDG